jgi:signal transduction histidine kinase
MMSVSERGPDASSDPVGLRLLLQEVTTLANEADSVDAALGPAMQLILERNGWVLGHACLAAEDDPHLFVDSGLWAPDPPRGFETFVEASRKLRYREGPSLVGEVIRGGEARWTRDVSREPDFTRAPEATASGLRGAFFFPIRVGDRVAGVLEFFASTALAPEPVLLEVMAQAGTQLGRVVERRDLERQLADVAAREQRRLGRELHDGVGQVLLGARMSLESLCDRAPEDLAASLRQVVDSLRAAHQQLRGVARGLSSLDVEAEQLPGMLAGLAARAELDGVTTQVECADEIDLPDDSTATHLFHIAQQAVGNALEHADASRIELSLHQTPELLTLEIRDDGRGLPGRPRNAEGAGLRIMQHRAALCGARLEISSETGAGTRVRCRLRRRRSVDA